MAGFFNLTQLGFQNTIRERCKDVKEDPAVNEREANLKYSSGLPAVTITPSPDKITPTMQVHQGSFNEFHRQHFKHQSTPFGNTHFIAFESCFGFKVGLCSDPNDLYKDPQTVAMNHGWVIEKVPVASIEPPNWHKGPYFPSVESEMTKSVTFNKKTQI